MATLSSVLNIARELGHTDSNGLTDTLGIDFANYSMLKMRKMLIDKGVNAAPIQEAVRSVTDGQGTYLFPSDMWLYKEMELNVIDTTNNSNYFPVSSVDSSNLPDGMTVGWLRMNQDQTAPMLDYRGNFYEIYPTPSYKTWGGVAGSTLNSAVRIFYFLSPTLFVTTSDTLGSIEALDYLGFADLIKGVYQYSLEKITLQDLEALFQVVVGKLIRNFQNGGQQPPNTTPLIDTGWRY